jgi:hypothetical protein
MVDTNVEIGDKVLIGGLYGEDFIEINNKTGIIKKIMFSSSQNYVTYIVDVLIDGLIVPINLSYIYKLDDLDIFDYDTSFVEALNPIEFYIEKFNVVGDTHLLIDQWGKSYLFCKTRENNMQPLALTNLN